MLDAQGVPPVDVSLSGWREGDTNGPLFTPSADGTFDVGPYSAGRYGLTFSRQTVLLRVGPVDVARDQTWSFGKLRLPE